jgi:hypothetical protein
MREGCLEKDPEKNSCLGIGKRCWDGWKETRMMLGARLKRVSREEDKLFSTGKVGSFNLD